MVQSLRSYLSIAFEGRRAYNQGAQKDPHPTQNIRKDTQHNVVATTTTANVTLNICEEISIMAHVSCKLPVDENLKKQIFLKVKNSVWKGT